MCGIVAVLRRRGEKVPPGSPQALVAALEAAREVWPQAETQPSEMATALTSLTGSLEEVAEQLRAQWALCSLVRDASFRSRLKVALAPLEDLAHALESRLDNVSFGLSPAQLEELNAALLRAKDVLWAVRHDRIGLSEAVERLSQGATGEAAIGALACVELCLAGLDRLEVRGRDSAGVHLLVTGHGLDFRGGEVKELLRDRRDDQLFVNGAVRTDDGHLSLVYKAAAEIGKLGDNGRFLREALHQDRLLELALANPEAEVAVLGHTRWASVGMINEPNAHPLNEVEVHKPAGPAVVAVLNGDVDNYADLKAAEALSIPEEISSDAKVIPVLVSRRLAAGEDPVQAFRGTVASFVGSVAVAAVVPAYPDALLLALRGSGQGLYVGLSPDTFMVASEPYGLVMETSTYLRLDGEAPGNPGNPATSRGQVVRLDRRRAGTLEGVERWSYEGTVLEVAPEELQQAEITTRDIDRGEYAHFLSKEIAEASGSVRKTLRGKIQTVNGDLRVSLGPETLPDGVAQGLRDGLFRQILVVGQGTAAVAGSGLAQHLQRAIDDRLRVAALPATELSGFRLRDDMSDSLVIAISQSGTTTDTNRTVDLVRARGAKVLAIVNRRHSDLAVKCDGVLYTSDGRDLEMSVASTKAFYSQIAAGFLLAFALAEHLEGREEGRRDRSAILESLLRLPQAMEEVVAQSDHIAAIAARHAPRKRYWAVVGNGVNWTAAEEIRIKLSELCYKAVACDATEDKKHIDLSSEPLILVCAAGLAGSTADDVAKEVGIYRAHKATPIVIASNGDQRFSSAVELISVPRVHPELDFVLSTVAGHLFGYHAALAIDALANPLRQARSALERLISRTGALARRGDTDLFGELSRDLEPALRGFFQRLRDGSYDGHLEASTAVELTSLLRYVDGTTPLDSHAAERGRPGTPGVVLEDLAASLSRAIDELTRPIDAIKHQAKTVTVGISRSDEALLTVPLVRELLTSGLDRDHISYADLRTLAALDPVVERVLGYTRYRTEGDPRCEDCTIHVISAGGLSRDLPSRTAKNPQLRGTKRQVALERRLLAALGLSDARPVLLIPEIGASEVVGITLLHVQYRQFGSAAVLRSVLEGYRSRYSKLRNAVTETEPSFREDLLETVEVTQLLCDPIHILAQRWRA